MAEWEVEQRKTQFLLCAFHTNMCKVEFRIVITLNAEFTVSELFNGVQQVTLQAVSGSVVVVWDTHPYQKRGSLGRQWFRFR